MNTTGINTNTTRLLIAASALAMVLMVSITSAFGQKTDFEVKRATSRDGLMDTGFMTKAEVSDDLDGTEDEYFYKFEARPGKLTVTLEVEADQTNAGAYLDLFGSGNRPIVSNMLVQAMNGGSDRASQSVNLAKAQAVVIRIKGIKYGSSGGYTGTYKIRLEGTAVNFQSAQPDQPTQSGELDDGSPKTDGKQKKPEATPAEVSVEEDAPITPVTDGNNNSEKVDLPKSEETDTTVQPKKPDAVDRIIEKGKSKKKKLINVLDKIKTKIPD